MVRRSRRPQDLGRINGKLELAINLKTAKQIGVTRCFTGWTESSSEEEERQNQIKDLAP